MCVSRPIWNKNRLGGVIEIVFLVRRPTFTSVPVRIVRLTLDVPGRAISYEVFTEDTTALLKQLGALKADVIGWSDGGQLALPLAFKHWGLVRRVVASGVGFGTVTFTAEMKTMLTDQKQFGAFCDGVVCGRSRRVRTRVARRASALDSLFCRSEGYVVVSDVGIYRTSVGENQSSCPDRSGDKVVDARTSGPETEVLGVSSRLPVHAVGHLK